MASKKQKIRPYYQELQGLWYALPLPDEKNKGNLGDYEPVSHLNTVVNKLCDILEEDYSRFRFPYEMKWSSGGMRPPDSLVVLRSKLGTIIMHLHGAYFSDEPAPFSGNQGTTNILNAIQDQNVSIMFFNEANEFIDDRLRKFQENTPERNYLQKLKDGLKGVHSWMEFITLALKTADKMGLMTKLAAIF